MKYFESRIPGLITFTDGDSPSLEPHFDKNKIDQTQEALLCDFINLYREDCFGNSVSVEVEDFAKRYGSLMEKSWLSEINLPKGFASMNELSYSAKAGTSQLYAEKLAFWEANSRALRDLALLAYMQKKPTRLDRVYCVRALLSNLVFLIDANDEAMYIYHSSINLNYSSLANKEDIPKDVRDFLALYDRPFLFVAASESKNDSLENRQLWITKNVDALLPSYLSFYMENYGVSEQNLLGQIQRHFQEVLNRKWPLYFCITCGKAFSPYRTEITCSHSCTSVCRNKITNYTRQYSDRIGKETLFTKEEAKRLLVGAGRPNRTY